MNVKTTKDILSKKDDYVLVSKDKINELFSAKKQDDDKLDGISKIISPVSTSPQTSLVSTRDESELIRQLYLKRLYSSQNGYANVKHYFGSVNGTISTAQSTIILNDVPQGNGAEQRIGSRIKLKHLILRLVINRIPTTPVNNYGEYPLIVCGIVREHVPATPGTTPTVIGTDADPPASQTLVYSRLGNSSTTYNPIAIRNPLTAQMYHIHKHQVIDVHSTNVFIDFANTRTLYTPKKVFHEWFIKFDGDYTDFAPADADPITNAVFFYIQSDTTYNTNVGDFFYLTSDLVFEDTQVQ
jgi:hypothetical protein